MDPDRLNELDVVGLSGLAWEIIDPDGEHESEERAWVAALRQDWPPIGGVDELRARLDEIVEAMLPPPPAVPLRAVSALVIFLAEHPERRRPEEAALIDALREAYPDELPDDVARWLAVRAREPASRRREHGASQPRRRGGTRPLPPDEPPG